MDARLHRRVQRYGWDAAADAYDRGWVPLLERLTRSCVDRAALQPGDRVLDLATGTGVGAFHAAAKVGPAGTVTGMDISERMVACAAAHRRARRIESPPIGFERRDMEDTGAADDSFTAVVAAFGLMYAADRAAALDEIRRVLAPGGRVSLVVWGRRGACGWAEVFPIVDAHVQSEVCPLFFALGTPGALPFALDRAGFTDVREERVSVTLGWASADEACAAMLEGSAVALAWKRFSPAVREAVREAYLASIEPHRDGSTYLVPSEVLFATGRKA